jgi:hypothetical protein
LHLQLRQVWQKQLQQHLVAAVWELQLLQAEEQQPVGQLAALQASSAADSAEQPVVDHQLLELPDQVEEAEVGPADLPAGAGLAWPQAVRARLPSADGRLPVQAEEEQVQQLELP